MSSPYRIGTLVKVKIRNVWWVGEVKDFITYKNGTRDYKVAIYSKGTKLYPAKNIRKI